jgi:toxin ParE1/3/4
MEIIWRSAALNDIESIREFIAQDNPEAAARVHSAIGVAVERLAEHPNLGRVGRVEGTRELIISSVPYIVAYRASSKTRYAFWLSFTRHANGHSASDAAGVDTR